MTPTLQSNDLILSDRITHRFREFQRGSVVLLENYDFMRIVGLPGETFEIRQGQVYSALRCYEVQ
ncbi:MAG: hypothetical protein F6K47_33570 [Symploca sp. SIO2E6]|nr:hypothetical protein [Symploca sp. SIO2E6]